MSPVLTDEPEAFDASAAEQVFERAFETLRRIKRLGGWTPPTVEQAARLLPGYEVMGLLGHGGMAAVYRARQKSLDRVVALKLLPREISVDRACVKWFIQESRTLARLSHPNIVAVYDSGETAQGHLYFVMELVEGQDLSKLIRGAGIPPSLAIEIILSVCGALNYAHGKGVVHRDIKPSNVLIGLDGRAKVADFGIALTLLHGESEAGQTTGGSTPGTLHYMSPEQLNGKALDRRTDVYSLGVMLYEMLCGKVPHGTWRAPSKEAAVDSRLDRVVFKAMQRAPEDRYQSTEEMGLHLDAILAGIRRREWIARRVGLGNARGRSAAVAVMVFLSLLVFSFLRLGSKKAPRRSASSFAREERPDRNHASSASPRVNIPSNPEILANSPLSRGERPAPHDAAMIAGARPPAPIPSQIGPSPGVFQPNGWRSLGESPGEYIAPGHLLKRGDGWREVLMASVVRGPNVPDAAIRGRFRFNPGKSLWFVLRDDETHAGNYRASISEDGKRAEILRVTARGQSADFSKVAGFDLPRQLLAGDEFVFEFRASGSELNLYFDGERLGFAHDDTFKTGDGYFFTEGVTFREMEWREFPANAIIPGATGMSSPPARHRDIVPFAPLTDPTELLTSVDLTKDAIGGRWQSLGSALSVESDPAHPGERFIFSPPVAMKGPYEVSIIFTMSIPFNNALLLLPLDGHGSAAFLMSHQDWHEGLYMARSDLAVADPFLRPVNDPPRQTFSVGGQFLGSGDSLAVTTGFLGGAIISYKGSSQELTLAPENISPDIAPWVKQRRIVFITPHPCIIHSMRVQSLEGGSMENLRR